TAVIPPLSSGLPPLGPFVAPPRKESPKLQPRTLEDLLIQDKDEKTEDFQLRVKYTQAAAALNENRGLSLEDLVKLGRMAINKMRGAMYDPITEQRIQLINQRLAM